ncbi:hypothetical protein HDA32_005783 [Spinactinospora alkalitolerans]|uniref:Secreted protein n=1 Tax=Spinactinospora alkalitolerans TaxID=687207 RepID=A0A852U716_9ACTN|nr:DUF6049 family protein [Spinactinospora alkalitolerans]NYE50663.1 hypothetical protein [Spinactinospora alkalitolerans]
MRRIAHLGAVTATALALVPALAAFQPAHNAPGEPAAAPSADGAADEAAPLIVEGITPQAVDEESTVTVTGRITNTTDEPLTDVSVRLRYSSYPLSGRDALDSHAGGEGREPQALGPTLTLDQELAPDASAPYELEADAEDLGLDGGFGVYPLTVDAVDGAGERIGAQNTFLPYTAGGDVDPIEVAWLWPLMDSPQRTDDDTYLDNGLDASLAPDGRLGRLLSAGAQSGALSEELTEEEGAEGAGEGADQDQDTEDDGNGDGGDAGGGGSDAAEDGAAPDDAAGDVPITWAVDPGLLDDVDRLSSAGYQVLDGSAQTDPDDPDSSLQDHEASTNAQMWLEQANAVIGDDPMLATPYATPDIAALLEAGLEDDADDAVSLGRQTVQRVLGRSADPSLAWPADGLMNAATRDFLSANGAESFVLGDDAMPAQPWVQHTPTAAANLPVEDAEEDATALVADSGLTDVLAQDSSGPGGSALARQRFAAETAMITAERPGTSRTVVAAPPRDWNPAPGLAEDLLEASDDLPWLDPVALTDIEGGDAAGQDRQELTYAGQGADAELSGDHLDRVKEIRSDIRLFNSILADDEDPFRPAVLRLESAWWRGEEETAAQLRTRVAASVRETKSQVRVMSGEPVTLASKNGTLGILVANDLSDHPVTVHLSIFSENSERLSIGRFDNSMEIGPGGKTTVYVPLSAKINGRTVLHMSLHNADGEPISSEEVTTPVNVTGLGTSALLISGAAALVLIVALAPRALRRWARKRRRRASASAGARVGTARMISGTAAPGAGEGAEDGDPPVGEDDAAAAPDAMPHNGSEPSGDRPDSSADSTDGSRPQ